MALFDSLLNEVNERFGLSGKAESLLSALLALMTDENRGGLDGFLDLFHRVGLGNVAESWVSRGANTPLSNQQLEDALSVDTLGGIADRVGVSTETATSAAAFMIPQVVDRLTPDGVLPADGSQLTNVGSYLTGFGTPARTGDMPDRPAVVINDRAPAYASAAAADDGNATLRWILPLILLGVLVGIGYYTCRPNEPVKLANAKANAAADTTAHSNANTSITVVGNSSATHGNANAHNPTTAAANTQTGDVAIREANERARAALTALVPNGTPQQVIEALNISIINFAKDSAEIPEENKNLLKQAAELLKTAPADTRIEVGGHTDNDGDDAHNQKLSEQRAGAVRNELVRLGVKADALTAKGYGEQQPRATNETPEGRFQNRRIEYKITTGGATTKVPAGNTNAH